MTAEDCPPAIVVTLAHGNGERGAVARAFYDGMDAHDHAESSVAAGHVTLLVSPPGMWGDHEWKVEEYLGEQAD